MATTEPPIYPDIRVVAVTTEVIDDGAGDPQITFTGCGYYEGIGMLLVALLSLVNDGENAIDDDEYPDTDADWGEE